uniref:Uncharacterized protein n=1 Tax=Leersia perrieri TaxID=77586 RepID=A0A0D9WNL4_9ORYZ
MMESVPVPNHDLSLEHARHKFGRLVAIPTHSQVLGDSQRVSGPRAQQPESYRQFLAVVQQRRLLVFLGDVVQRLTRVRHVPLGPDPPHHLHGHGVDLFLLWMAQAPAPEHAGLAVDLDHRSPGLLAHVPLVHQPPDLGHVIPPAGSGEQVGEEHVTATVVGVEVYDAPPDRLAEVDVAVNLARSEERAEDGEVWLHWHFVDHLLGFVQLPCSAEQVDHTAVVLHLGLDSVGFHDVVEVSAALGDLAGVGARREHVQKRDIVRRHANRRLHPFEQLERVIAPPVHGEPADHAVPRREPLRWQRAEHTPRLVDGPTFAVHVDHRRRQLGVHLDPALLHPPVHLPAACQRARPSARHQRGRRDEPIPLHSQRPHFVEHLKRIQKPPGLDVPGDHGVPRDQIPLRHSIKHLPRIIHKAEPTQPTHHRRPRHDIKQRTTARASAE